VCLAAAVGVVVVVTHVVDFEAGLPSRLLNANLSESWSHRATAATLAGGGIFALLRAASRRPDRLPWALTGTALLVLFVVEASPVHVAVDRLSYGKLIYLPLLVALALGLRRLAGRLPPAPLARAAVLTLIVSYIIHVLGLAAVEALGWGTQSLAYQLKVGIKQGTELAGWLLLVLALWRLARPTRASAGLDDRLGGARKLTRWPIGSHRQRA
jgi:hypothetical protein